MSIHCPTCAAVGRWAPIWAERRARDGENRYGLSYDEIDEVGEMDLFERTAWIQAKVAFYWIGRTLTPESVARLREVACQDVHAQIRGSAAA